MSRFALKVKTKSGHQVVNHLTKNSTIKELKDVLFNLSNIPIHRLHVLSGYPPKTVLFPEENAAIHTTGISSGDTLILEEKPDMMIPAEITSAIPALEPAMNEVEDQEPQPGILLKHIVPADNSCLFSSIYFVLNGKLEETATFAPHLRKLISISIANDTETYSEAMLGKPNADYCAWIQDHTSWGGAIELAILSNLYGLEIAVVDITNGIINRFGEDKNYTQRVFLMFDGIHYDPLYMEPVNGGARQTIFPTSQTWLLKDATMLAQEAKASRQFTDVNRFTLKCLICNIMLVGQEQAQKHATLTGHANFGEV